jgi:hypothetical protein
MNYVEVNRTKDDEFQCSETGRDLTPALVLQFSPFVLWCSVRNYLKIIVIMKEG